MSVFAYTIGILFLGSLAWMIAMIILVKQYQDDARASIQQLRELLRKNPGIVAGYPQSLDANTPEDFEMKAKELIQKLLVLPARVEDYKKYRLISIICTVILFISWITYLALSK